METNRPISKLSEDDIDDLIYLARTGDEDVELMHLLEELAKRENTSVASIIATARDESGAGCLHMASANGHAKTVARILSQLPIIQQTSKAFSSDKASQDQLEVQTKTYSDMKKSSDPNPINAPNEFGNTPLHWACLGGHLDVLQLLLSRGADPTATNSKDQIPLDMAASNEHMNVVEFFLAQSKGMEGENAQAGGLDQAVGDVRVEETETVGTGT